MENKKYYVGLDIGTSSVGYAVTDEDYNLLKHNGEPMWGSHIFEEGVTAEGRRSFRTARRRNARKKQRVALLSEIFAPEIANVDERFFIRRQESALYRDDVNESDKYIVFNDKDFTDRDYYEKYPTIHHLICELIQDPEPHDVRLVYMACAYLVAHRGHFLSEVSKDDIAKVTDFQVVYDALMEAFSSGYDLEPWHCDAEKFKDILKSVTSVRDKEKQFLDLVNEGEKFKTEEDDEIALEGVIKLLSGGTYDLAKMFPRAGIEETKISFKKTKEEEFEAILVTLEDYADFLLALHNVYDWSILDDVLHGNEFISLGKVDTYEQHKADLEFLKYFVRKYCPKKYYEIFRASLKDNYVAYSYNLKNTPDPSALKGKADKTAFCDYIKKIVKDIEVEEADREKYDDMMLRLENYRFCPKQVEGDNRVIPYQLYYYELKKILENAEKYLPFLREADADGYVNKDKILSIMEFRVPYYVGPLRKDNSSFAWIERKAEGKIYPWNFTEKVDLDKSEQAFIQRMINTCTYLPGEKVLPKNSLLYQKFSVLNEINNIKINGMSIPVEHKQGIFELFKKNKKMTVKRIEEYLTSNNLYHEDDDILSGFDQENGTINSSYKTYHDFRRLIENGTLTEEQAEEIVERITYSEDKNRIKKWLQEKYADLPEADIQYLSKMKYKDFGRLSRKFLVGLEGTEKATGEMMTILERLWNTNDNLMQILSDKYTYADRIQEIRDDYYHDHPMTLNSLMEERYINNSVKRSIYRTLDILKDIRKTTGGTPERIFIEMARGGGEKGKRTSTRRKQIEDLYAKVKRDEVRELSRQLDDASDNELQSEVLYLYFMQLGKCAYTGRPIDIHKLKDGTYNVDHIWPQSYIKDDSLSNKVLVLSEENSKKGDKYPISAEIRQSMKPFWTELRNNGLMSAKKYERLTRYTKVTEQEKQGFINRQLTFTEQSTKAAAEILQLIYPKAEIIYSKARLTTDFRHEVLNRVKCRSVNDLHHAKDAYLNIVVGNVYHCRFTKNFHVERGYTLKPTTLFSQKTSDGDRLAWNGAESIEKVRKTIDKNNIHYTKYAFMRKGGLFDQMPLKAKSGLIPRKKGLDVEKYGGYNKSSAAGFILVKYSAKKKSEMAILPVDLMESEKVFGDDAYALSYCKRTIMSIFNVKEKDLNEVSLPFGRRAIKINTVFSFDNFRSSLLGKSNTRLLLSSMMPLVLGEEWEAYVKKLEAWTAKSKKNNRLELDEDYDGITEEKNLDLYDVLSQKVTDGMYSIPFSAQVEVLKMGKKEFEMLNITDQVKLLNQLVLLLKSGRAGTADLSLIGGKSGAGLYVISMKLSNWKNYFEDVRLVDVSPSGIYQHVSDNLLDLF